MNGLPSAVLISPKCSFTPNACHWVPLDPSFKLKTYGSQNIDLHDTIQFDYTSYYRAILNNDTTRMNKNPLEIFEGQVTSWLSSNMPGKTLEDVANSGVIQSDESGLLPASLPYVISGTARRYNSAADHDAQVPSVEPKLWIKKLWFTLTNYDLTTGTGHTVTVPSMSLVDVATKRLTVSYDASLQQLNITLGNSILYSIPSGTSQLGQNVTADTLYDLSLYMDGPPSTVQGTADQPLTALYQNMKFGGNYQITTGGETSNWSQVHRAAQQLLDANNLYKIVFNPSDPGSNNQSCDQVTHLNCTPYLDVSGNGWDPSDPTLASQPVAMEALTGGLLYVAGTQYFVKQRENLDRLDHLNHTKSPISGFMGVVSSVGTPEYIAGTAFSILPGGLLIDMKGDFFAGSWRIGQPATTGSSNKIFELAGHVSSSLEHEIWQELTGYDAVSTVRGIQMALATGATLLNAKKNATQNTLPAFYTALGFTSTVPSGFTYAPVTLYSTQPALWTGPTDPAYFDLLKSDVDFSTSILRRYQTTYAYASNFGIYIWVSCVASQQQQLNSLVASGFGNLSITLFTGGVPLGFCDGSQHTGTVNSVLSQLQTFYQNTVIPIYIGEPYFDIFDRVQGFVLTDYVYRLSPPAIDAIDAGTVQVIRDTVSIPADANGNPNGHSAEFYIPSRQAVGSTFRFSVYIFNDYDPQGNLDSNGYFIFNNSVVAGGGYVDGKIPLNPATSIAGQGGSSVSPSYNNATLTNVNTISEANNNIVKTPSTVDPVSTVTGNNYHDETDFVIKGKAGLNIAFTRTYNSAPSSTKTDLGLGSGWVHSYGMHLTSNDYGKCPNCSSAQAIENGNSKTSSITYTDERGGDHNYLVTEDASHIVTAPQGEFDSLALDTPVSGQHTLTFRNGTKYIFEAPTGTLSATPGVVARLKQIADPWGNQLNFTYTANDANGRLATVKDNLGISGRTGLVFSYDANNRLQSIADWSGRTWLYSVVNAGTAPTSYNLASFTNPLSQTISYGYTAGTHNLTTVTKPLRGVQTTFTYYQNGRTFSDANGLRQTETLDYDLFRNTTRVTDPRGGIRTYEYDQSGRMTKLTEPDGAILQFQNQGDGLRFSKTDGLGYPTQYSYRADRTVVCPANTGGLGQPPCSDTGGNVTREQDALNQTVDTTYGPFDQVASVKDKRGTVTTTSFHTTADGSCRLTNKPDTVTVSALSGLTNVKLASFCWNADGSLKSQTDYLDATNAAKTRVTTYTYDTSAHLNVQSIIVTGYDGTSVTRSYTYDSLGRKQTEALNRRTSPTNAAQVALTTGYSYDALDRVTQVTDALGNQMQTVFDANGKVSQVVGRYKQPDASFVTRTLSTRSYDAADRMIQDVDVNGNAMLYAYDASGNLIAATDRENHTARYEYDAMNRRTAVIDPNGFRTTTGYDLAGHVISITNGNGETANSQFDAIGRLTRVTDALGFITLYSYDANGNRICMIDSNAQANLQPKNIDGCSESRVFDELNRVVQVKDALNGVTRTAFDLLDNITSITDASNKTTSMSYDGLGRLVSVADPLAKTTAYARDEAGNVYQSTNRKGQVTQTTFDNLNRPILVNYLAANGGDNTAESIAWDSFGNRQSVANSTVNYTFGYDAKSRLTLKTDSRAGRTLSFTYDRADNILTKTDYQNEITAYEYDSANRLIALKNAGYLQASYQYDGAGRLLSRILSNGAQTQYTYDANGWAATLAQKSANGTVLSSTTYTRDRVGNITSQSDTSGTTAYTYDARYWLTNADYPSTAFDETFTYDAVGNRLTHTLGGTTRAYEYLANSNRLATIHTGTLAGQIETSFFYDDEGRLTSQTGIGAKILTWDQKNRAKSASSLAFNYDPMDYRIGKTGCVRRATGPTISKASTSKRSTRDNNCKRNTSGDRAPTNCWRAIHSMPPAIGCRKSTTTTT